MLVNLIRTIITSKPFLCQTRLPKCIFALMQLSLGHLKQRCYSILYMTNWLFSEKHFFVNNMRSSISNIIGSLNTIISSLNNMVVNLIVTIKKSTQILAQIYVPKCISVYRRINAILSGSSFSKMSYKKIVTDIVVSVKIIIYSLTNILLLRVRDVSLFTIRVNLSKVNFFVLGLSISAYSNDPRALDIARATGSLLQALKDGAPFSRLMDFYHSRGVECTIDDLLAWSVLFQKQNPGMPLNINNDTGIYKLSENSVYNRIDLLNEIHFETGAPLNHNVPLDQNTQHDSDILSDASALSHTQHDSNTVSHSSDALSHAQHDSDTLSHHSDALSEAGAQVIDSLLPLFGMLCTFAITIICNVIIENIKTYLGIRTGDDDNEDDDSTFE
jgi:hypothetical protein